MIISVYYIFPLQILKNIPNLVFKQLSEIEDLWETYKKLLYHFKSVMERLECCGVFSGGFLS